MRVAWKFLAPGAVGPFGGLHWPPPSPWDPGGWVRPAPGEVFACRVPDLPWWLAEELWEVELAEPLRELETQVAASAGRLLRRIEAWDDETIREYGITCAHRARALAVAAFRQEGRKGEAEALAVTQDILPLARLARDLSSDAKTRRSSNLAGYLAESATRASQGAAAAAASIAANAAVMAEGSATAYDLEREWQARWIARRTGLPQP